MKNYFMGRAPKFGNHNKISRNYSLLLLLCTSLYYLITITNKNSISSKPETV